MCYLNNHFNDNFWKNINLQRKIDIDTKIKVIYNESKNIIEV